VSRFAPVQRPGPQAESEEVVRLLRVAPRNIWFRPTVKNDRRFHFRVIRVFDGLVSNFLSREV
jgi:hypothetical protein